MKHLKAVSVAKAAHEGTFHGPADKLGANILFFATLKPIICTNAISCKPSISYEKEGE